MTLAKSINDQLQNASPNQAVEVRAFDEKLRLEVKLADCGRLGCLLDSLNLEHIQDGQLAVNAVQVAERITYLEERLDIIESEGEKGRTLLRSTPPKVDGQAVSFFEMVLDRSTRLSLVRYRYDANSGERTPASAPLTRDTLERLIGDLLELTDA
jgi:hypothetical protein